MENSTLEKNKPKSKEALINKRFNIILLVLLFLLIISIIISQFKENHYAYTLSLYFGVYAWFLADYKMLRSLKMFIKCLYLAILLFILGILISVIDDEFYILNNGFIVVIMLPFTFLLTQRVLRLAFINYTGLEPIVDKDAGLDNGLYSTGLVTISMIMSFVLKKIICYYL